MIEILQKGVTDKKSFDSLKAVIMLEVRGRHPAVLHYKEPLPQKVFSTLGLFSNSEGR